MTIVLSLAALLAIATAIYWHSRFLDERAACRVAEARLAAALPTDHFADLMAQTEAEFNAAFWGPDDELEQMWRRS